MKIFLPVSLIFFASITNAQPVVSFQPLASGLSSPVDVVDANDGTNRLFIVEKTGAIRIWNGISLSATPFLNIGSLIKSTGGEQGLLSTAFHPNYSSNGYFFVYYNDVHGNIAVSRFQRSSTDANLADATTGVNLLTIPHTTYPNHNGGKLLFGSEGYLYFGTGDGGSGGDPNNNAQNGLSLLGKMLRIDVNGSTPYAIPPTNPYVGNAAYRGEIIAVGLRNPWRWSFDRANGNMWIADVGQDAWEEVNATPAANILGANYGWSCLEGIHFYKSNCTAAIGATFINPVFEYPHNNTNGGYSITGGFVYRGAEFPLLQGYYLSVDFVSGNGWLIDAANPTAAPQLQNWPTGISSFGEAADGTLYATNLDGTLYKVIASTTLPVHLIFFAGRLTDYAHELTWKVSDELAGETYSIEKSEKASGPFNEVYKTSVNRSTTNNSYTIKLAANNDAFYRLKTIGKNGEFHYSQVILIRGLVNERLMAYVIGNTLYIKLPKNAQSIAVRSSHGQLLCKQSVVENNGLTMIALDKMPKGVLVVTALTAMLAQVVKVIY